MVLVVSRYQKLGDDIWGFVEIANRAGAETIEINLEPSAVHSSFDRSIQGKAGEALPSFVELLLQS